MAIHQDMRAPFSIAFAPLSDHWAGALTACAGPLAIRPAGNDQMREDDAMRVRHGACKQDWIDTHPMHATEPFNDPALTWRRLPGLDNTTPQGELMEQGQATGIRLPGAVLEAAMRLPSSGPARLLLFLTDDVPCEESLRLILVGPGSEVLDQLELGGAYTTGALSDLRVLGADRLGFRFIGDTDWTVQVLPQARWTLPCLLEPRGVSRARPWIKQLVLKGQPRPQSVD